LLSENQVCQAGMAEGVVLDTRGEENLVESCWGRMSCPSEQTQGRLDT
jgi:hypothetical protein